MMEAAFFQILNLSITGGFVILCVLAARFFFRKMPKIFSYVLWSVVLFRLLCPFSFSSAFSLLGAFGAPAAENGSVVYFSADTAGPEQSRTEREKKEGGKEDKGDNGEKEEGRTPLQERQAAGGNLFGSFLFFGSFLWIIGMVILCFYSAASLIGLKQRLKSAVCGKDRIYRSRNLDTPFVMGVLRPRIYLPDTLGEEEERYILLHERTHIRRGDHLIKLLSFLALCLHWFNPFVWAAFFLSGKDMEMSCDESVIRKLGGGVKKDYSKSLLALASGKRIVNGAPLAFGEGGTKKRVRNVLYYRRPAVLAAVVCAAAVGILCAVLLTNPGGTEGKAGNGGAGNADTGNEGTGSGSTGTGGTGNGSAELEGSGSDKDSGLTDTEEFLAGEGEAVLADGSRVRICLVLKNGSYVSGEEIGYGGGYSDDNYTGMGELQVWSNGKMDSVYPLTEEDGYTDPLVFNRIPFEIRFGDYNGDGSPDFSLGQWGSSSIRLYSLFTVDENGGIRAMSDAFAIASSDWDGEREYSAAFSAENGQLLTFCYNNATGENEEAAYPYDAGKGWYEAERTEEAGLTVVLESSGERMEPGWYEGSFDFNYDRLKAMTAAGQEDTLQLILPESSPEQTREPLVVGEDYYTYRGGAGTVIKETYTLEPEPDGSYRLPIYRRNTEREETAVYYVKRPEGVFVFQIDFKGGQD